MQITVWQHIYSNVPKEQSPNGRRGYQTLLYSQDGLSREDVLALEEKAQYYAAAGEEPVKRQFFTLPDGRAVVSQTVPLREPDEFGRKGRYLSHSLVISVADFAALDYCPALLFNGRHFFTRPEEALSAGQRGDIPPRALTVGDGWQTTILQAAAGWPQEQLLALARLGWQAARLKTERQAVALNGAPEEVMRTMALLSLLTPPDKRPALTFDSHAYGCDWSRDWPFWGWGGLGDEQHKAAYVVDCDRRQVAPAPPAGPETPYERWTAVQIKKGDWSGYLRQAGQAWRLDQYFQGRLIAPPSGVDKELGNFFAQMNQDAIAARVLAYLPPGIGRETAARIKANVADDPWGYLEWANQSPPPYQVAEIISGLLLQDFRSPPPEGDRKLLLGLAKESKHAGLAAILQLQAGDVAGWQKSLDSLSEETYQEQVRLALSHRLIGAGDAFSGRHLACWRREFGPQLRPGEIDELIKRWQKLKGKFMFDNLTELVPHLVAGDRQTLAYWLDKQKINAPALRRALGVPPQPTLLEKVRGWWPQKEKKKR